MHIEETFSILYWDKWREKDVFFLLKQLGKKDIFLIQKNTKERSYDIILENHEGNLIVKIGEYEPEGKKALRGAIVFSGETMHYREKIREKLIEIIADFYKE